MRSQRALHLFSLAEAERSIHPFILSFARLLVHHHHLLSLLSLVNQDY